MSLATIVLILASLAVIVTAAVFRYLRYLRVYRDPVVLETERHASTLMQLQLSDLPSADRALDRAKRLDSVLMVNELTQTQWQRAVRAGLSSDGAIEEFCVALGARLLEPVANTPGCAPARDCILPALTLRFARATTVCAITGGSLRHGDAVALATAVYRDGKGPREAIAVDLTERKDAQRVLEDAPHVAFVVLSAEGLRDILLSATPGRSFERVLVAQRAIADLSPYQTQGAVTQEAFFFGRERELRSMADRNLKSFLVVGARQMGKSTLLQALNRRLHARDDVEARYVELASSDLLAHLEHVAAADADAAAALADPYQRLIRCAAGQTGRPRIWLLDETDDFVRTDAADGHPLTRAMRKLSSEGRAHFVLAGYWDLYAAKYLDPDHPLRNLGEFVELGPLDRDAAVRLATEPMEALGITWHDDARTRTVDGTGRRANLIVLLCKALIESLPADQREITATHVDAVLRGAPEIRERTQAYKALRDELRLPRRKPYTDLDRAIVCQALLMHEADGVGPTVRAVRAGLEERGIDVAGAAFEDALARLELGYILIAEDGRLSCPVPLMREQLERRGLDELVREYAGELMG